ncbi:MAG: phage tail sheath subtilisin-like domain-containing protein, partial [Acidobacteriota bacterium]
PAFIGFVSSGNSADLNRPIALHRKWDFDINFPKIDPKDFLAQAVSGFFLNGGEQCYVVGVKRGDNPVKALTTAMQSLLPVQDFDLLAIPDAMALRLTDNILDEDAIIGLQNSMLSYCQLRGGTMAILDALPVSSEKNIVESLQQQCNKILDGIKRPVNGAIYFPWLILEQGKDMPPCGHVAGIIARSDKQYGVFKAPANEKIKGVQDLTSTIDNEIQGLLNELGINCLRVFPGRGIRVWGARTLNYDYDWRYINYRRTVLTLERWIEKNLAWAAFEPNTPQLWVRISRALDSYLAQLWKAGALQGETAEEAFYIKCDSELNPTQLQEIGRVTTELGLALNAPAEFVIMRIVQHTGIEPR